MRYRHLCLIFAVIMIVSSSLVAQQAKIEPPQRTDQERWNRASHSANLGGVMVIALGKAKGMTIEEIGAWLGKQYAPGWSKGMSLQAFFNACHRNFMTNPTGIMEATAATENELTWRANRPYLPSFGDKGIWYGVTLQEYEKVNMIVGKAIADWIGLEIEDKIDGMWWITTVRKKAAK
jgi:hypothetical protein